MKLPRSSVFSTSLILGVCISATFAAGIACAQENEAQPRPTVGLVLGGGGARGAAHVGVIQVLDELRIPVDLIAGTSMGALVGGLYASGMTADELAAVIETSDWPALLTDRPPRAQRSLRRKSDDLGFLVDFDVGIDKSGLILPKGLVQGQNLELALKRLTLPVVLTDDFDDLPIPFRAVAADVATGEAVVIDSGDLASAMRASMSVPGIFKPARRNGRLLVDGGVANNLPVQIVRDMGADVLIVVDVGSPLRDEEQLGSALAVTKQMLRLLIHDRARDQAALLTTADILISPELGGLGSRDFLRAVEAQESGKERARELSSRLAELSVSSEEYLAHRQRLEQRRHGTPYIDRVVVETGSSLSPKVIAARLAEQEGKLLDLDQLESDISDIYGFDTFETVSWNVLEKTDGTTLVVRATEKSWGPNYLRFGINLEDDFEGESNYSLAVRFTRTEINKKGGELRAEIQMGATLRLFAELYQPLDFASRWFVNPQIETQRTSSGIFDDRGLQIARLGSVDATVSLAGGRQFGNRSEFRLGVTRARGRSKRLIGPPLVEGQSIHLTNLTASFEHDTIDRVAVPRSGTSAKLSWFGFRENLGSDLTFDATQLRFLKPQTWGDHTVLHWWNLGRTANDRTPGIRPFELGGLFNLSGYASGELAGSHAGIGRLLYYHRLRGQLLSALGTQIYLGASIEAGNVWQSADAVEWNNTLSAGSVFVVFDSPLGPLYFAYGAAEGGRQSAYLFLGQTF